MTEELKAVWACPDCGVVPPEHVTFEETHDPRMGGCGLPVDALSAPPPPVGGGAKEALTQDYTTITTSGGGDGKPRNYTLELHFQGEDAGDRCWALHAALSSPPLQGDQGFSPLQSPAAPCAPVGISVGLPDGHVIVPCTPTKEMRLAANRVFSGGDPHAYHSQKVQIACEGWAAMIAHLASKPTDSATGAQPEGRSLPND